MKKTTYLNAESISVSFRVNGIIKPSLKSTVLTKALNIFSSAANLHAKDANIIHSLNSVTFSLDAGDCVYLNGHNGAGKSTLLKVLAGVYKPTSGSISTNGKINALLGLSGGALMRCTGVQNIFRILLLNGLEEDEIKENLNKIREFSGLNDFLDLPVSTYSDGMLVRLMFSIATCQKPDILLIDEIIGAGDSEFTKRSQKRILELINESSIAIISTHSKDFAKQICNKTLTLNNGIVESFTDTLELT